jgi:uncharacterized protein
MKLLIVLGIIFLLAWLFRSGRKKNPPAQRQADAPALSNMVRCPVCQLHLPQADAVVGARGQYCSLAHHDAAEVPPPAP